MKEKGYFVFHSELTYLKNIFIFLIYLVYILYIYRKYSFLEEKEKSFTITCNLNLMGTSLVVWETGFNPWSANLIPHATTKDPTCHSEG